jgi:hypothetical protein
MPRLGTATRVATGKVNPPQRTDDPLMSLILKAVPRAAGQIVLITHGYSVSTREAVPDADVRIGAKFLTTVPGLEHVPLRIWIP